MSVTILKCEYDIDSQYSLILFDKVLRTLPIEICSLINLRLLDLSHNNLINHLPIEICNLINLEYLDLSRN